MTQIINFKFKSCTLAPHSSHKSHLRNSCIKISDYFIYETIGMGGFAKVKRAVHSLTNEKVAVKIVCLSKMGEETRKHLKLEIDIHKRLNHSNIAKIYEIHQVNDKLYIFMEYCQKGELFDYIDNHGPLSIQMATKFFKQIYSAVCYLHENGIAHRDIKTENILLTSENNAKLIDFGMANYCEKQHNAMLETFCGSPCYLSPEMLSKKPYNAKLIDVWCLGVTFYVMLTARLPFYDKEKSELIKKITHYSYERLEIPQIGDLIDSMLKCSEERISLQLIRKSEFFEHSTQYETHSLSPSQQSVAIDNVIVQKICLNEKICKEDVQRSIKECKTDRLYGFYFIELERSRKEGYQSCYNVNSTSFMKKRRSSVNLNSQLKRLKLQLQTLEAKTLKIRNQKQRNHLNIFTKDQELKSPGTTRENSKKELKLSRGMNLKIY